VYVRCVDDKDKATAMALGTCVSNLAGAILFVCTYLYQSDTDAA